MEYETDFQVHNVPAPNGLPNVYLNSVGCEIIECHYAEWDPNSLIGVCGRCFKIVNYSDRLGMGYGWAAFDYREKFLPAHFYEEHKNLYVNVINSINAKKNGTIQDLRNILNGLHL